MKITRIKPENLTKEEWTFHSRVDFLSGGITFFLVKYELLERESKRHKFKPTKVYEGSIRNNFGRGYLSKEQVSLPLDVIEEAKQKLVESITFEWKI
jgi:hypothetical protein